MPLRKPSKSREAVLRKMLENNGKERDVSFLPGGRRPLRNLLKNGKKHA